MEQFVRGTGVPAAWADSDKRAVVSCENDNAENRSDDGAAENAEYEEISSTASEYICQKKIQRRQKNVLALMTQRRVQIIRILTEA